MFIIVYSVIHSVLLLFLLIRYYRIVRYPEKFAGIPGFEDYKNSEWYWDRHRRPGRGDHPKSNPYSTVCWCWLILNAEVYVRTYLFLVNGYYENKGAVYIFWKHSGLILVPLLCCVSWIIYITALIPFPETISECLVDYDFLGFHREKGYPWKKLTTLLIVVTLLSWPACIIEAYNVGYVTETKLVYPEWYQPKVMEFDQIKKIYIFRENTEESEKWTGYIYDSNTNKFDIRKFGREDEDIIEVTKYILDHVPSDTEVSFK